MALDRFKKKKTESKVKIKGSHFKQRDKIKSEPSNSEQKINFKNNNEENIVTAKIKKKLLKEKTPLGKEEIQAESIDKLKNSTINHNNQQQYENELKKDNLQINSIKQNCSNLKSSLKEVALQTEKMADNLDDLIGDTEELESSKRNKEKVENDGLGSNSNQDPLDTFSLDKVSIIIILHILLQRFFTDNQDNKK
ncbi:hypothetical protein [Acetohalobium arabaticum]|uniref:Uncharacterized protein n=1 Tax=Acetohalobium arabaticum (strain ATCC 49924 / DSM 5501 / Z-7288) TaxID=574087 RepID=D9QSB3_ACEAZ|nr:hypothetical protein [Acetohalobium arabaticum]ADL11569.1 hypothetical protein Acear_0017 [Acetohalobium arabaticum DSM 5501]